MAPERPGARLEQNQGLLDKKAVNSIKQNRVGFIKITSVSRIGHLSITQVAIISEFTNFVMPPKLRHQGFVIGMIHNQHISCPGKKALAHLLGLELAKGNGILR